MPPTKLNASLKGVIFYEKVILPRRFYVKLSLVFQVMLSFRPKREKEDDSTCRIGHQREWA